MPTVLVVDDDPSIQRMLRHILSSSAVDVVPAFGVQHALDCLQSAKYDAIVLDLVLGHRSGFDVLDAMRTSNVTTPVIVASAKLPDYARMLLRPEQVLTIVKKPFDVEVMTSAILGLCGVEDDDAKSPSAENRPAAQE